MNVFEEMKREKIYKNPEKNIYKLKLIVNKLTQFCMRINHENIKNYMHSFLLGQKMLKTKSHKF